MLIRFTSSLTPEDENLVAPALLKALSSILSLLPIAYVLRIDTSDANVYQCSASSAPIGEPAVVGSSIQPFEIER